MYAFVPFLHPIAPSLVRTLFRPFCLCAQIHDVLSKTDIKQKLWKKNRIMKDPNTEIERKRKSARCRSIMINNTFFRYGYTYLYSLAFFHKFLDSALCVFAHRETTTPTTNDCGTPMWLVEVWEWSTNVFPDWKSATISTTKHNNEMLCASKEKSIA